VVELVSTEGKGIAEIVRRCPPWLFGYRSRHDWSSTPQNLEECERVVLHDKPSIHPPRGFLDVVPSVLVVGGEKDRLLLVV
jgi:hypothetical protein